MSVGRRHHTDTPFRFELSIPTSVVTKMDLLLLNPLTGKPRYGGRSKLVTTLLREHLKKMETTINLDDRLYNHLLDHGQQLTAPHLLELLTEATRSAGLHRTMPLLIDLLKEHLK